jgi:hypothetical protein
MANVSWWKVLKRQWGEVDELRKQERECWSVVGKLRRAGDDYQTLIEQAESIGREADIIAALWRRQLRVYWDAVNAIRSDFPELLELFPYADGIEHDDIDPKAAAKAMQGLAGKILATSRQAPPQGEVEIECLTPKQQKIVRFLLEQKRYTSADRIKVIRGAFGNGAESTDRAVSAAIERIKERWLSNGYTWDIVSQDTKGSPRYKLEKHEHK